MNKRFVGSFLLALVAIAFTGCSTVQNYSLRSYQGPLPIEDYRWVDPESYGVPSLAAAPSGDVPSTEAP